MLNDYLKEKKLLIENNLKIHLNKISSTNTILDGMKYSVLNGGKRIRPILLLMILDVYGVDYSNALDIASALEMIHSYSLVHDDLPAIDNDDYRRGELTTHKKFGEAEAILIGDALLTHSFFIVSESKNISVEKIIKIIKLISTYAGANGMIAGQMVDIESENKEITFDTLKYIHRNKTGKMLQLPIEIGAILCNSSKEEHEALKKYAENIGLAFQIKDDILDIEGDFLLIGKNINSDIKLEKKTYPKFCGLEKSKEILIEVVEEAKKYLNIFPEEKIKNLLELADYIAHREK